MRQKLKELNEKLTKHLDNLKGKKPDKSLDQKMTPEVMEIEMENADNQIKSYRKEIAFLQNRLKEGDQIDQIQTLEQECYLLAADEESLEKQLSQQRNVSLVLANKTKKLAETSTHKKKIEAMIEKRKVYTMQKSKVILLNDKLERGVLSQKEFSDKLYERYINACKDLGEEPMLELKYDEDEKAIVMMKEALAKSTPQLRTIILNKSAKKKPMTFTQSLMMDDPDNYKLPQNEEEFNRLKEKVMSMFQSARVEERQVNMNLKRSRAKTVDTDKRKETMGRPRLTHRKNSDRTGQGV